jgi:hypothetical protein
LDIHRICRNLIFRHGTLGELEAAQANHRDWVEQVQETQRPRMSFSEAAARCVSSLPPQIQVQDPIPYDRFYRDQDGQPAEDPLVKQARQVETAWQRQQEMQHLESEASTTNGDWDRAKQEALDHEMAERMQADDQPFREFIHYDPTVSRDEQEDLDQAYAQSLAHQDDRPYAGPCTRAQTNPCVHHSDSDAADESDRPIAIIRLGDPCLSDLSVERARYDATKRQAKDHSIG